MQVILIKSNKEIQKGREGERLGANSRSGSGAIESTVYYSAVDNLI